MQRVAFMTGVSSGISYATAALLAKRGFRVFGTYQSRLPANLASAISREQMDVNYDSSVQQTVSGVLAGAGRIDVLINNAGYALMGALEKTSLAEARDQFDTNFFGTLRVTQQILPIMRREGFGRIVNVSSILGLIPGPWMGIYTARLDIYTEDRAGRRSSAGGTAK